MPSSDPPQKTSPDIADRFARDGYVFPVDVLSRGRAAANRRNLEALEQRVRGDKLGNKNQLNFAHVIFRFAHEIVTHPKILDAVEAILGPDILVWGSTFFVKEPQTESFVSWHQDLRYWGLDSDGEVSAWVALSPVTEANGCMRFVPGSHTGELLHASGPNRSDERRIGFAINYISTSVRQTVAHEDFAMLVRGEDRYGHFKLVPPPSADLSEDAMTWHRHILTAQNEALYEGAVATEA